jgi:hypothetical protein
MAASFRNVEQILALAGCDRITIAPKLLRELATAKAPVERKLKRLDVNRVVAEGGVLPLDDEEYAKAMAADRHASQVSGAAFTRDVICKSFGTLQSKCIDLRADMFLEECASASVLRRAAGLHRPFRCLPHSSFVRAIAYPG